MTKKLIFLVVAIVIIGSLLVSGCGKSTSTPTPTPTYSPTPTKPSPTPTGPKSGGTLRVLWQTGISDLSWVAKQGMTDETLAKAYSETLVYYAGTGDFKPELAKSWDIDNTNKTLTFHLQQGVKFQDGTDFNAEAVRWNVQNLIDSHRLSNSQYVDSIEVVDNSTFRYHLNAMMTPSLMLHSYGYDLLTMFSPTAYQQHGGANGGADWMTSHFVSTGAFMFDSWTQDVSLKIVRNPNYWRGPQYPYLDAIEFTFVADPTVASAKMQAGEADLWAGPPIKEATDLQKKGLTLIKGVGGFYSELLPDDVSADSPFIHQEVREALEYAIDRDAMAAGLGYGILHPVKQAGGPSTSTGYNPNYTPREFSVQKAKDLLAAAGYSSGFNIKILVMSGMGQNDQATAIQADLAAVGIKADIDVADPGRFIGAIYKGGWAGELLLWMVPVDPEFAIGWFVHFGPQPIFPYPSLKWPDTYWAAVEKVRLAPTVDQMRAATVDMMTLVSEGAYLIPLMDSLNLGVAKSNVHTAYLQEHFMTWHNYLDWLDK